MERKPCAACRRLFRPRPQNSGQRYCSDSDCQLARRRQWQKSKRQSDPDYLENQAKAQRSWTKRNPDYWRQYRQAHPEYENQNRKQQTERNARRQARKIAKMDSSDPNLRLASGVYRLSPWPYGIAKMNAWMVEITVLSYTSDEVRRLQRDDSIGTGESG